jgi:hypothetical protein
VWGYSLEFFYCCTACIIQGFLFYITLTMPGLSRRRPTSVTTVPRGMIKETLCISVAESERAVSSDKLFLQPQYVSYKILQLQRHCHESGCGWHYLDILRQYP